MTLLQNHVKIALRNLWKFKIQTVVCLLGLSVGMACFALGTLWLRYIESFEDFVPDAENVYLISGGKNKFRGGYDLGNHKTVGEILKDSLPEVIDVGFIDNQYFFREGCDVEVEGKEFRFGFALADDGFLRLFGIRPLSGSVENLREGEVILTESVAQKIFGTVKVAGKEVSIGGHFENPDYDESLLAQKKPYVVKAVVPDCPRNSQFRYEIITAMHELQDYNMGYGFCFVKLNPRADLSEIVEKQGSKTKTWQETLANGETLYYVRHYNYFIVPLRRARTDFISDEIKISTTYIRWFMLLGVLVILCSLCNYIITMVNHLRRRAWEMSLRRVLGASIRTILAMVSTETFLTFLLAAVFGWLLTLAALPFFRQYSEIDLPLSAITLRLVAYLALVIAAGCALAAFVAWFVMKKTQQNILGARQLKHSSTLLDRVGVILQLALSMGIVFSTTIMLRQVNYLMYTEDVGFAHVNIGVASYLNEGVKEKIWQSPLVEEVLEDHYPVFPKNMMTNMEYSTDSLVGTQEEDVRDRVVTEYIAIDSAMFSFYHASLVAGRLPVPGVFKHLGEMKHVQWGLDTNTGEWSYRDILYCPKEACINEQLCREIGWTPESAIGKKLYTRHDDRYVYVVGVMKDWYVLGPTIPPSSMVFIHSADDLARNYRNIAFRTKSGRVGELCDSIEAWKKADPDCRQSAYVENAEKKFEEYVASEQMLIKILLAVALCSLLVCVLGAFSLVSLSLTERRKEIAIRKAHGAHISDILQLFLRSHYLSLAIAALISFPVSYLIMKNWLENYTKQVGIDWWLIPATFLLISCVVIATISFKIYFAAKEKAARALVG